MPQTKRQKQVAAYRSLERRIEAAEVSRGLWPSNYVQARKAELDALKAKLGHLLPGE